MLMLLMVALAFGNDKVDSVKAIIAVEFQKISIKEAKLDNKQQYLDELKKTFSNVDSVKHVVKDLDPNVRLCNAIKKLDIKLSNDTIGDDIINKILNSQEKAIFNFYKNGDNRKDVIKHTLEKIFKEYNKNVLKSKENERKAEEETGNKEQVGSVGTKSTPWRILFLVTVFISLLIIAGITFYFFRYKKDMEKRVKDDNEIYKGDIYTKKNKISDLENENKNLKGKIKKLEGEIDNYKEAETFLEGEIEKLRNKLSGGGSNKVQQEKSLPQNKTTLYLGLAHDGVFVDIYEQYKSGKVLFQLNTYDNEIGEFEFVLKPETLSMVNNSITGTIETACVIENDDISIINSIETITKGKVKKESNEWVIKDKAVVRLS